MLKILSWFEPTFGAAVAAIRWYNLVPGFGVLVQRELRNFKVEIEPKVGSTQDKIINGVRF